MTLLDASNRPAKMKATKGCWTCKTRKVGCDRALPACDNCIRTARHCRGYGLRLQWHEEPDGRRKNGLQVPESFANCHAAYKDGLAKHFINMTVDDMLAMYDDHPNSKLLALTRLPRQLSAMPSIDHRDSQLLTYYESRLSPMISTLSFDNGFKSDLLPMALNASHPATLGLRNAMMAVAAFHSADPQSALPYKLKAIRFLSQTLSTTATDALSIKAQLATSLMLCVHNVFDESQTDWLIHLNGARRMLFQIAGLRLHSSTLSFLSSLFYYHYVLGDFVRPVSSRVFVYPSCQIRGRETTILGHLGCSLQLLEIIHQITRLRTDNTNMVCEGEPTPAQVSLATQVKSLQQHLPGNHQQVESSTQNQPLLTAELYRLATLLYLYAVCPGLADSMERGHFLHQALEALQKMEICTSPWPLFIVASE